MDIEILSIGPNKAKIIKIVRELTGWGLKETKDFIDAIDINLDSQILNNVPSDIISQLREEGVVFSEVSGIDDFSKNMNGSESSIDEINPIDDPLVREAVGYGVAVKSDLKKYVPIVASNKISQLDREGTMKVLLEAAKIAKESESFDIEISRLIKLKENELLRENQLRKALSKTALTIIWSVTIISFLIGLIMGGFLCILTGLGAYIIIYGRVRDVDLMKHKEENETNAQNYHKECVEPLEQRINELYEEKDEFQGSGKQAWAIDVVGSELFYSVCILDLYDLVKNRRADNLKEALNKYDDTQYKARMLESQTAIMNASEIAAREAVKQTALVKDIEKNTHQTATAARQTAYHTRNL